ncbi:MAG: tRNA pseudouridine(13) synthase TruD [Phycisphaerae bacterium]|nr:tRNA pseudouridine(13) synthase TruD [Phycisphaerae bacterium]
MNNQDTKNLLPYLTADLEGVGGAIKTHDEDFFVEEKPLYEPCGQGTHIYALMEKKGTATMDALSLIARELGIAKRDIGYAGLKDARAVTRQWISIEHIDPQRLVSLDIPNVKIIKTSRHKNKLKIGHLSCNSFVIRLRDVMMPLDKAQAIIENVLAILVRRGVPNYFGQQRFGIRSETHLLGEALSKGKIDEFVDIFLGRPQKDEPEIFLAARTLYEEGDYKKAVDAWPYSYSNQRRALKALIAAKGNKKKAYHVIDKHLKGFFVSAFQSDLFNQTLAARMPDIDKLLLGDMAYKHINGACFRVEDAAVEQPRCDAFEISPTGPLLGSRMTRLTGPAGEIENSILDGAGLNERDFEQMAQYGGRGGRRPLRFGPRNHHVSSVQDEFGLFLELRFELDSGCYATCVLREICKNDQ